jgi:hypothetical protein
MADLVADVLAPEPSYLFTPLSSSPGYALADICCVIFTYTPCPEAK